MQYLTLNALMKKFNKRNQTKCGFTVLGFPCNQFGLQEPGTNAYELKNGLKFVRPGHGFKPKFPIFGKIDVNGKKEHKLYTFLKVGLRILTVFRSVHVERDLDHVKRTTP